MTYLPTGEVFCRNDESTKTRIETGSIRIKNRGVQSRNDESTKTRIETAGYG